MKKCTKGEMKAGKINCGQFPISIDGRHFAIIKFTHLIDMEQDEANAKELARRWNAFEKNGLVEELRIACEALMKAPDTLPPDNEFDKEQRDYRNSCMTRIDEARKLGKAALAKS